jgi:hypothetical protein
MKYLVGEAVPCYKLYNETTQWKMMGWKELTRTYNRKTGLHTIAWYKRKKVKSD